MTARSHPTALRLYFVDNEEVAGVNVFEVIGLLVVRAQYLMVYQQPASLATLDREHQVVPAC